MLNASGELSLDPGAERDRTAAQLLALPGIGPWTVSYIRMRALSDPDAFLPGDVGVLDALRRRGRRRRWPRTGDRGVPTPCTTCGPGSKLKLLMKLLLYLSLKRRVSHD